MTKRKRLQRYSRELAAELHGVIGIIEAIGLSSQPTEDLLEAMITAFRRLNASCDSATEKITALFEGKTA